MNIETVVVGDLETNCYLIVKDNEVIIIDPGDEADKIKSAIGDRKVVGIIITHYHFDHIGALEEIQKYTKSKIYDFKNLNKGKNKIGNFEFEIVKTPGHKEDAISIYFRESKIMFVGDFIFANSIGRWDLEGGDIYIMKESIKKILNFDDNITLYPGHGPITMLGHEKRNLEYYLKYF